MYKNYVVMLIRILFSIIICNHKGNEEGKDLRREKDLYRSYEDTGTRDNIWKGQGLFEGSIVNVIQRPSRKERLE